MRWQWRRRWLQWTAWLLAGVVLFLCTWGFVWEPSQLVERDYVLRLPGWTRECDGLRVDVLADIHTGSPHNGVDKLDRIVRTVANGDADVVLLAGDYVILSVFMGKYVDAGVVARHLRPLAARKPVYGVLGNHDWWKDGPKVAASMRAAGITMVDNRSVPVSVRGCEFWLAGIGDLWEGDPDIAAAFAGIPDDGRPAIALSHNPDLFPRLPERSTLLVAGHTHGGQVTLPLLGNIVAPSKLGDRYASGHVEDDGEHVFVSPGLGTSILPVRFGIPPEISRLTLLRREPKVGPVPTGDTE
ncbi:MAG TPA: metallophosphoesterase [Xanthomonadaceae bacterium]|nr:metallophosphoesterase [Xanthomonadaceae bacterium]